MVCNWEKEIRMVEPPRKFKKDKSLLLSIHLKQFRTSNCSMLFQMIYYFFFSYILGESWDVDHFCWWATIPVIFGCISIETIEIWVGVLMRISSSGNVWMLWIVNLQALSKQHSPLYKNQMPDAYPQVLIVKQLIEMF